ncbi:MAG: peptide ABC transporter substrate-binding protein, partial [Clostridiales bacterium]|nr:peptide ABC transporter substrate-binding protein [Clostridiales bacterium]
MKKLLAMMLASVILLGVTSCGGNNPADTTETQAPVTAGESAEGATDAPEDTATEETAAEGDILNISLATTPETIDPNLGSALDSGNYANHLFEGLMRYKWDGTGVEFGMAESYEVSDDGLVWTFKLRDSQWSDGQPVKAQDFVFSWQRLVDPEVAAPYNMDMGKYINNGAAIVEGTLPKEELGVKAVDDKTLEVTLQNPTPYFDQLAAFATFSPLRQDTIEANGDNWTKTPETYLSNGPFKMLSYTPDDRFECVPNPGYWDAASVKPAQINWL